MYRLILTLMLVAVSMLCAGCSHNYYNIPRESYEQKVRVLGVAPLFLDAESDMRHPERDALVNHIRDYNRNNEQELHARIKDTGSYFAVKMLPDDPEKLFAAIFFRRERRDDAGIVYNKYFYKGPELKDLISRNGLDAIFLVVVSGITTRDTTYSSNLLSKLTADNNNLIITGQIIDQEGNILWEFPNFRQRRLTFPMFLRLQYPDFDEARENSTDQVDLKFKTIPGINRFLAKGSASDLRKGATVSEAYSVLFDEMVGMLRPEISLFGTEKKAKPQPAVKPETSQQQSPQSGSRQLQPAQTTPSATTEIPKPTAPSGRPAPTVTPPSIPGSPPAEPVSSPTVAPPS